MKLKFILIPMFIGLLPFTGCEPQKKEPAVDTTKEGGGIDRTSLPIKEPARPVYRELDVRKATPPQRFEVKAPDGAPNVLLVLVDDLGFAGTSTFGGPVPTPTFDRVASQGVYYNNCACCTTTS